MPAVRVDQLAAAPSGTAIAFTVKSRRREVRLDAAAPQRA